MFGSWKARACQWGTTGEDHYFQIQKELEPYPSMELQSSKYCMYSFFLPIFSLIIWKFGIDFCAWDFEHENQMCTWSYAQLSKKHEPLIFVKTILVEIFVLVLLSIYHGIAWHCMALLALFYNYFCFDYVKF